LNTDGIKVTGNAKSPEVIARLIDSMEASDPIARDKSREAAMATLARIGRPAVPKLIEATQNAPNTAAAIRFANVAKWPERYIRKETIKLQARAAMVLGKIGDARALPVLRSLLAVDDPMRVYFKEAIADFEEHNGGSGPAAIDQASADDEMYEVYSAAIRDLFLSQPGDTSSSGASPCLIVVSDHTATPHWDVNEAADARGNRTARWDISENPVERRTIEDFKRKSGDSIRLESRFTLGSKQVLISGRELGKARGWAAYYRRYPHSLGIISMSRVGFNAERDQALVYIDRICGGLCGEGDYVLLVKEKGAWSVRHRDTLWES
jgi:hypothetical protein